ncbi:FtsP/CotA-like multicopper oxidase with cupredoxin domain [Thermocatellispora tengchongensis]|uniref:FtsP/CotA-like multicopper oxidase with cupredoxin domain n=1 Tax=Thermocatellispora tengchongensis TaxID=1073253 RepID=A0A840P3G9_9ACTN|nr:multicopper oxidase domain-containing protein [Thermocatellispora tengchongensis]MBB5134228.1 FtsP/CotA-like multicopper oxidase with cupredoxin domain [Thermocatellispora tengchongensis]
MNRRQFLAAVALSGFASACGSGAMSDPAAFRTELRVPPLLVPKVDKDGTRRFALTMQRGRSEILPGKPVETWGFNGPHLGPTIRVARGDRVRMAVTNRLDEASTVHWHGMRLPAKMDGGPHQMIEPGGTWSPHWTIDQPAATSWYHPHPHGATAEHVYRGLAGMFIIDDPAETELPAKYGIDDVPLILQDKNLAEDGSPTGDPLDGTFGILGEHMLVNGTHAPFLNVRTERVRFRILNGSNARMYHLAFADRRAFHVVGGDAGLLPAPVQVEQVSLTPGERVEVVAAFTAGEQVLLRTLSGSDDIDEGDFDLLKIVAAPRLAASPRLPSRLAGAPAPIAVPPNARVRRFQLNGHDAINRKEMDLSRIDEVVPAGATEIWEIENTVYAHNFHIHEVAFQVLDVDGEKPPAYGSGHKDTVYVPPKSTVRLAVRFGRFTDPATPYMYHCHILRHEDSGMMGQFVIVEPGTENQVPRTIATDHAHHGA